MQPDTYLHVIPRYSRGQVVRRSVAYAIGGVIGIPLFAFCVIALTSFAVMLPGYGSAVGSIRLCFILLSAVVAPAISSILLGRLRVKLRLVAEQDPRSMEWVDFSLAAMVGVAIGIFVAVVTIIPRILM